MSDLYATVRPAGSRRFLWTVLAFALANAAVWVTYLAIQHCSTDSSALPVLKVEHFAPGDAQTVTPRQPLSWTFNADVGPQQPGPVAEAPGIITPAVAGKWAWSDRRTLTFTPDADLPRATRFTLKLLPQMLPAPAGTAPMPQPFVATVQTRSLQVTSVRHVGMMDGRPVLELAFSDAVQASDVLRHVSIVGSTGSDSRLELHGAPQGRIIRVRCDDAGRAPVLPNGETGEKELVVSISPGLAGTSGPLGLEQKVTLPIKVISNLTATGASPNCPPSGDPTIGLSFNGRVNPEIVGKQLSIEPAIPFGVTRDYDSQLRITGAFTPGTRYTVKIAAPPAGASGEYCKPGTLSVFIPDRPSSVWLEHEEGYLGAKGNRTLLAHAVNVPALRVTIVRIYDNTLVAWRNANERRRYGRQDPAPFARPIASRRIELPAATKNQVQDVRLSLDELLPEASRSDGVYRVSLSSESAAGEARQYDLDDEDFPRMSDSWRAAAMVTLSDIGLSAKRTSTSSVGAGRDGAVSVWAVSLSTGKPIRDVRVRLFSTKSQPLAQAITDENGLASLSGVHPAPGEQPAVLIADVPAAERQVIARAPAEEDPAPAQLTWLDLRTSETPFTDADVGGREYLRSGYEAFVYTDRGVYRPGETVQLRAIVRGPAQAVPKSFPLKWQLRRPDLRDWKAEIVQLDADGAAGLTLALPADLPTGRWTAQAGLAGESRGTNSVFGSVAFQVEEYIPERIKASMVLSDAGKKPARLTLDKKSIQAELQADYLFGRPAGRLPAEFVATLEPARFTSPNWRGWAFGDSAGSRKINGENESLRRRIGPFEATTSDSGQAKWPVDLAKLQRDGEVPGTDHGADAKPRPNTYRGPWELNVVGTVREEGGRAVVASQTIAVDAVPHYLGLRPQETAPRAAVATSIAVAAVVPSGELHAVDLPLTATLYREVWNSVLLQERGRYRYRSTRHLEAAGPAMSASLKGGRTQIELTPPSGGRFVLIVSDQQNKIESSIAFYAVEPSWQENISRENPEKVDLVLLSPLQRDPMADLLGAIDQRDASLAFVASKNLVQAMTAAANPAGIAETAVLPFRVGQRPRVLVRSPFAGQLLLCVETDGVISRQVVDMPSSQIIVPIDVTDACRPGAFVTATVIRAVDPQAKWRAHRAYGITRLSLDPADRRLNVTINAPSEMRPEQTLSAQVRVTDDAGHPVSGAAVTVAAVDEGILQLTHFKTPEPLAFFLSPRALGVRSADLYGMLMPEVPKPRGEADVGGDDDEKPHGKMLGNGRNMKTTPVPARRVRSVALFTGVLHTDAAGIARIELPVAAFSGRLRLMAVAYSATDAPRFGNGETEVVVRAPVLVQTSLPRFAAPGDKFRMPLTVFNNSGAAGNVKIRIAIEGDAGAAPPLQFAAGMPHLLDLPPFDLAAGGQASRSVELKAPQSAGVARIRITAEMKGESFTETIELPVRPAAPELTEGGFAAAKPDEPAKIAPPEHLLAGTRRLQVRVTPWPNLGTPRGLQYLDHYPYGCAEQTLSTAFPLVYLGDIGPRLDPELFKRDRIADKVQAGILRLMSMQTHDGGVAMWPGGYETWPWASIYAAHFAVEAQSAGYDVPEDFRDGLLRYCSGLLERGGDEPALLQEQGYACYVLSLAGKPPRATMSRLGELLAKAPAADGGSSLYRTSLRWHLTMAWLSAGRRDLALNLMPAILPKAGEERQLGGNLASPLRDRALLLQALLAVDPKRADVAALAMEVSQRLGNSVYLGTHETATALCALGRYMRHTADAPAYDSVEIWSGDQKLASSEGGQPLSWDLPSDKSFPKNLQVRVAGKPQSQAFIAWLQSGVPTERPANVDSGMIVRRRYLDLAGKPLDVAHLNSGDLVRVELTLQGTGSLENVVIEDLLPAGLEVENPRLQSGAAAAIAAGGDVDPERPRGVQLLQVMHTDFRDDRVSVMTNLAYGKGSVTYLARAVSPGVFSVPPVRAECMYDAGIRSVWSGDATLTVQPPGDRGLVMR
jgi:uncharacterized protein YfaS (alpha-2-macroglobulin family)